MAEPNHSFEMIFDANAYKNFGFALFKTKRRQTFFCALRYSITYGLLAVVPGGIVVAATKDHGPLVGFIVASGLGLFFGFLYPYVWREDELKRAIKASPAALYECDLADDYFVMKNGDGSEFQFPWSSAEVGLETKDAMSVRFGKKEMMIYLSSLRQAGLEPRFRELLAKGVETAKESQESE